MAQPVVKDLTPMVQKAIDEANIHTYYRAKKEFQASRSVIEHLAAELDVKVGYFDMMGPRDALEMVTTNRRAKSPAPVLKDVTHKEILQSIRDAVNSLELLEEE